MTMEGNKNTEATGFGDSKWADIAGSDAVHAPPTNPTPKPVKPAARPMTIQSRMEVGESSQNPQSTVPYTQCDQSTPGDNLDDLSLCERMGRLEKLIVGMRDELDDLKEFKEEVENNGCGKCPTTCIDKGKGIQIPARSPMPAVLRPSTKIPVPPIPVAGCEKTIEPSYERGLNTKKSFASVADNNGKKGSFNWVSRRKAFAPKKEAKTEPITQIRVRERHLKIRFVTEKKAITTLGNEHSTKSIRIALNQCLTGLNETKGYFSICGKNRFGDILLTLAENKVDDIMVYIEALRVTLVDMGLPTFRFECDAEKVKVFVGMVPLIRSCRLNWSPEDWVEEAGYREISNDVEQSNPWITVAAKPSWVGGLRKFHNQKQSTNGMILLLEKSVELTRMMSIDNPKIIIGGKKRFCQAWREESESIMCARCLKIGHVGAGCDSNPVCLFC